MGAVPPQAYIQVPSRSPATRQFPWRMNKPLQASPPGGGMCPIAATNAWTHWAGSSEDGKSEGLVCTQVLLSENSGMQRRDMGKVGSYP